jgi:hypothetical protein
VCSAPESWAPAGPGRSPDLGEIVRRHAAAYQASHPVSLLQQQVLRALASCRTAALGGHLEQCERCGHRRAVYHSCRNRHCPQCQGLAQEDWLEARRADLLPIAYFHVVFTLPQELRHLALARPRVVYGLLFTAASKTLQTFARDPKHLGGEIGLTAILHTWSQTLALHPHLHCVVTGGALASDGSRWIPTRHPGFLFPVRALAKVFRGKFLDGLTQAFQRGELGLLDSLPALLGALRRHDWVVYAKPPFAGPESVLRYLGRYTHRIALSNRRILRADEHRVAFRYRDYADGNRRKILELPVHAFIRRFLLHVLPKGFVRIRHYGLLANRSRRQRIASCRELLAAQAPAPPPASENLFEKVLRLTGHDLSLCPACSEGRMAVVAELDKLDGPTARIEILDSS